MELLFAYAIATVITMAVAGIAAVMCGNWRILRCAGALLVNWFLGLAISGLIQTDAWQLALVLDSLTAIVILYPPRGEWQGALGISYVAQILIHLSYGFRQYFTGGADAWEYYNWISVIAFAQLFILGGWGIADLRRWSVARHRLDRGRATALPLDRGAQEP